MKNIDIINEIIDFHLQKKPAGFLKIPFENLGKDRLDILINNILFWQKIVYTSPTMANKGKVTNKEFYLLEDKTIIDDYSLLFESCPELNYFFLLKTDKIVLNPELSKEEIRKLQKMINEGYQHSIKINIRGNLKK